MRYSPTFIKLKNHLDHLIQEHFATDHKISAEYNEIYAFINTKLIEYILIVSSISSMSLMKYVTSKNC